MPKTDRKVQVMGEVERRQYASIGKNALGEPCYREVPGVAVLRYDPFRLYDLSTKKVKLIEEHRVLRHPTREDLSLISPDERELIKVIFGGDFPPLARMAPHVALMNVTDAEEAAVFANTYGLLNTGHAEAQSGYTPEQEEAFRRGYAKEIAEAPGRGWNPDLPIIDFLSIGISAIVGAADNLRRFYERTHAAAERNSQPDIQRYINEFMEDATMDGLLAGIRVSFAADRFAVVPAINCGDNLLTACILMVWLDLLEGNTYARCGRCSDFMGRRLRALVPQKAK
jgi:hypothetical protein